MDPSVLQAPYWGHLGEAWERRHHPNLLFLYYEDMKEDTMRELRHLNTFLGTALTEQQLAQVAAFTGFKRMKKRPTTNFTLDPSIPFRKGGKNFIRKGEHPP